MSESTSAGLGGLFLLTLFCFWAGDVAPFGNTEVTTYNVDCDRSKECKPADMFLYRQVFRSDINTLTVTSWVIESNTGIAIDRDCAIHDKHNWICKTRDIDAIYRPAMHEGRYLVNPIFTSTEQVPWYQWWWYRFLTMGNKKQS